MPKTTQGAAFDGIWAVGLVFQILETLARSDQPWRLTDIAQALGTTKTRVFRYLQTLMALGYVSQERDTDRYRVGVRLILLGNAAANSFDIVGLSRPMLHELRERLQLAVVLSKIEDEKVIILHKVDGPSRLSINAMVGRPLGLHCSAQGKLVLAFSPDDLLKRTLAAGLIAETSSSITSTAVLKKEIARVRTQGWATAPNESLTGLNVAAVPIFDATGRIAATIGILGSVDEIGKAPTPEQLSSLKAVAREISSRVYGASAVAAA